MASSTTWSIGKSSSRARTARVMAGSPRTPGVSWSGMRRPLVHVNNVQCASLDHRQCFGRHSTAILRGRSPPEVLGASASPSGGVPRSASPAGKPPSRPCGVEGCLPREGVGTATATASRSSPGRRRSRSPRQGLPGCPRWGRRFGVEGLVRDSVREEPTHDVDRAPAPVAGGPLHARRRDRPRGDGRRAPGDRHGAGARGRGQAAADARRHRPGPGPLPIRGAAAGRAGPSRPGRRPRRGPVRGRRPLPRHGAHRGHQPDAVRRRRADADRPGRRDRRRPGRRPRLRARARHRAPRREAGQRPARPGRSRTAGRLRHRPDARRHERPHPHAVRRSGRPPTWPPSRSAASRCPRPATSTRSGWCCSRCSPPAGPTPGRRWRPRWRGCTTRR